MYNPLENPDKSVRLEYAYNCLDLAIKRKDKELMHQYMTQFQQAGLVMSLKSAIASKDWKVINYHAFNMPVLKAGCDLEPKNLKHLKEALIYAVDEELKTVDADLSDLLMMCIENLLEAGVSPNVSLAKDPDANMPLHKALESRHPFLPALLLKYTRPLAIHIANAADKTTLQIAIENRYWPMIKVMLTKNLDGILNNPEHYTKRKSGYDSALSNILEIHIENSSQKEKPLIKECIQLLMRFPFSFAVINDNLAKLLKADVIDWDIVDLLATKAREQHTEDDAYFVPHPVNEALYQAYLARSWAEDANPSFLLGYMRSCLEAGAAPAYVNNPELKNSLLHLAIENRDTSFFCLLLGYASLEDLYLINCNDHTPLSLAADMGDWDLFKLMLGLVKSKTDYTFKHFDSPAYKKAFSIAVDKLKHGENDPLLWECIFLLIELSISLKISESDMQILKEKAHLAGDNVIKRVDEITQSTPLHKAIEANDGQILAVSSQVNDMEIKNFAGKTPILHAATLGHWHQVRELVLNIPHMENDPWLYGRTLAFAVGMGEFETALLLLEHGKFIALADKIYCLQGVAKKTNEEQEKQGTEELRAALCKSIFEQTRRDKIMLHQLVSQYPWMIWHANPRILSSLLDFAISRDDLALASLVQTVEKSSPELWIPFHHKHRYIKSASANRTIIKDQINFFLLQAIELKQEVIINYLRSEFPWCMNDSETVNRLFEYALETKQPQLALTLLNKTDKLLTRETKKMGLKWAAQHKNKQLVTALMSQLKGPSFAQAIESKDWEQINYHALCQSNAIASHLYQFLELPVSDEQFMRITNLCQALALAVQKEVNTIDADLSSLLMACIENLLEAGAHTSLSSNSNGDTLLHIALQHNHPTLPLLLLKHGDPDMVHTRNQANKTPLQIAINNHNWGLIKHMFTRGLRKPHDQVYCAALFEIIKIKVKGVPQQESLRLQECIHILLQYPLSQEPVNTALDMAIQGKSWEMIDCLATKALKAKKEVPSGKNLSIACPDDALSEAFLIRHHAEDAKPTFLLDYMHLCLESGANPGYVRNPELNNSLLHLVTATNDIPLISLLLRSTSLDTLHLVNSADETVFSIAAKNGNWTVLESLLTIAKSKMTRGSPHYNSAVYETLFSRVINEILKNEKADLQLWGCVFLLKELSLTMKFSESEKKDLIEKAQLTSNDTIIQFAENIAIPVMPQRMNIRSQKEIKIEEGVNEFFEVAATSQKNPAPEARKAAKPAQDLPAAKPDLLFGNRNPKKCLKIARWVLRHYRMNNMGAGEGLTRSYSFLVLLDKATPISMHWKMIALGAFLNQDIPKSIKGEKLAGLIKTQLKKAGLVEYIKTHAMPVAMDALGLLNDAQLTKVQTVILKRANKGEYKSFDSVNDLNLLPEGLNVSGLKPKPL